MKKDIPQRKERKIIGLPIYTILDGKRVGKIRDAVVSNLQRRVSALLIEEDEWYKGTSIIPFGSIQRVGKDAVMIQSENEVISLAEDKGTEELVKEDVKIVGKKVITLDGKLKGEVSGFLIDSQTGAVTRLKIKDISNPDYSEVISGADIITFGKDALVVSGESETKTAVIKDIARRKVLEEKERAKRTEGTEGTEGTEETTSLMSLRAKRSNLVRSEKEGTKARRTEEMREVKETREIEKKPVKAQELEKEETEKEKLKPEAEAKPASYETPKPEERRPKRDLRATLEKNFNQTLLGKSVVKDISGDDGSLIIKAGETVTEDTIKKAKKKGRILALSFFAKEAK